MYELNELLPPCMYKLFFFHIGHCVHCFVICQTLPGNKNADPLQMYQTRPSRPLSFGEGTLSSVVGGSYCIALFLKFPMSLNEVERNKAKQR